jgi:ATP-dependent Clp protease ATP-binding subunit ClpB
VRHLVKVGYDPVYGARPIKRAVQRELETPLGRKILGGDVRDGDRVYVDYDERTGELTFTTGLPKFPEMPALPT